MILSQQHRTGHSVDDLCNIGPGPPWASRGGVLMSDVKLELELDLDIWTLEEVLPFFILSFQHVIHLNQRRGLI